jgi:hypothetical protein
VVAANRFWEASPQCVAVLNEITERSGAVLVVSSTWRIGRSIEQLEELLEGWGVKAQMVGVTPVLRRQIGNIIISESRGKEINAWLLSNENWNDFVILDDDDDMRPLLHKLVRTSFDLGLQPEHIKMALALLS